VFDRVVAALFGGGRGPADDAADRELIAEMIEGVVDAVEPRVRLESRYRDKLAPGIKAAIAYLRAIGREGLEPVLLTRAAWNDDPRVNAFFATADDVPRCLGRSKELRGFFDNPANAAQQEAFALLGMLKEERTVFGAELQGDTLRQDVAQVSVSFSGHRLLAPAATLAAAREAGVDGVVCGHIHHAEIRRIDGVLYCNDGDWVESCTALVEHRDGRLEIIDWPAVRKISFFWGGLGDIAVGARGRTYWID